MKLFALALAALMPGLAAAPDIEKGKISGNPSAPIRLEIFSDFQCPSCKALHDQVLPQLIRDYVIPGKVFIVAREFPRKSRDKFSMRSFAAGKRSGTRSTEPE